MYCGQASGDSLAGIICSQILPLLSFSDELRQAIVAMMNRKDELEEENGYCDITAVIHFCSQESMNGDSGALLP
jgi:hypothetical protein